MVARSNLTLDSNDIFLYLSKKELSWGLILWYFRMGHIIWFIADMLLLCGCMAVWFLEILTNL